MKRIIILIFLFSSLASKGQIYQKISTWEEYLNRLRISGMLRPPYSPISNADTGSFYYNKADSAYYSWSGNAYRKIGGGSDNSIATGSRNATGDYVQNWLNHWFFLNNLKALDFNSYRADDNHPGNKKRFRFYSDSTIDGNALQLMWGLKNITEDNTDSIHFELTSTKNLTYLYQHTDGGGKSIEMDWDPFSFYPSTKIYANGNGRNGYYELGASIATINPEDSTRVKLLNTPGATKMVTAQSVLDDLWTIGVTDIPTGVAALNNVGSGLRRATTPNGSIKTDIYGYGVNGDSTTNANSITVVADTSELVTPSDLADGLAAKQPTGNYITALTGPVTASGPGSAATSITNNAITDAMLRQSAALSVVGRSANSTGNVADIAASDNQVLRRSGTTLGFGSLQTQHSISGNGIGSPFQLTNDAAAPGSNKVYGTNASGVKGYQSTTVVNLSSPTNGQILVYQDGEWVNVDNNPVIPESQTTFKVGVSGMAAGDSVYTDASLEGKMVKVYREGERMFIDTIYGIEVDTSTGTITFHPYMSAGEKIIIEAGNYSSNTPVITLEDLDFPTETNLAHTGTTWNATNATSIYNGYGLSNKRLAPGNDGYIRARYTASDGSAAIIAFNTSNTSQKYADNPASPTVYHYEAGAFVFSGTLYRLDNNTAAASVGGISVGDYWRIIRTGSTLKLQTSPDASVWTDRYTYTFSSTADLYINANIDANTGANKLYEPKGYNVE